MCVCVCVCVCESESERERERKKETETKKKEKKRGENVYMLQNVLQWLRMKIQMNIRRVRDQGITKQSLGDDTALRRTPPWSLTPHAPQQRIH